MKRSLLILGSLLIMLVIIIGIWYIFSPQGKCISRGGSYGSLGLSEENICNLKTSDYNYPCTDSDYCEGTCMCIENCDQNSPYAPRGGCSEYEYVSSCYSYLKKGEVETICSD